MRDMREMTMNASTIAAMAAKSGLHPPNGGRHNRDSEVLLTQTLSQLETVTRALAASDTRARAAEQRIEVLAADLAHIQRRIIQLAHKTAQARHLAHHDGLTGLPNRTLLLDRLKQATAQAARQNRQVALLFLDLDGFKSVNDTFGHVTGDKLLQQMAERISSCIRGGDTASRYGGDEFVIMLPDTNALAGTAVAQKIRSSLDAPFVIDGDVILVTASIGVAVFPVDAQHYNQLLKHADIEMYLDKAQRPPIIQLP
jgi:diguanylate cyclase